MISVRSVFSPFISRLCTCSFIRSRAVLKLSIKSHEPISTFNSHMQIESKIQQKYDFLRIRRERKNVQLLINFDELTPFSLFIKNILSRKSLCIRSFLNTAACAYRQIKIESWQQRNYHFQLMLAHVNNQLKGVMGSKGLVASYLRCEIKISAVTWLMPFQLETFLGTIIQLLLFLRSENQIKSTIKIGWSQLNFRD